MMSNLTIVVWQHLAKTEVLVLWIITEQKMLTNAYVLPVSLVNIVNQTLTIAPLILAKMEALVLTLSTITNVTAYQDSMAPIAKSMSTNVASIPVPTEVLVMTQSTISFVPVLQDTAANSVQLKSTNVPEVLVCIKEFASTN